MFVILLHSTPIVCQTVTIVKSLNDVRLRVPNMNIESPAVKAVLGDFNYTLWSTYKVVLINPESICKLRQEEFENPQLQKRGNVVVKDTKKKLADVIINTA